LNDLNYWRQRLREAELELDAATRRSGVDVAEAKRPRRAKADLKGARERPHINMDLMLNRRNPGGASE
jgi:hypothetical protein